MGAGKVSVRTSKDHAFENDGVFKSQTPAQHRRHSIFPNVVNNYIESIIRCNNRADDYRRATLTSSWNIIMCHSANLITYLMLFRVIILPLMIVALIM